RTGVDRSESTRGIAAVKNFVAEHVAPFYTDIERAFEILTRVVNTDIQRLDIRIDQFFLAFELLADKLLEHLELDPEQRDECADIDNILEKLPLACVGKLGVAERH